jgi:hypothetical protein
VHNTGATFNPLEIKMKRISIDTFLRGALAADGFASGVLGVLLFALPDTLAGLLGLADMLLRDVGLFLMAYGVFVGVLATRPRTAAALVWIIIIGNVLWAIGSLALIAGAWVGPNLLGYAFVIVQALAVGVFAGLQLIGVRRTAAPVVAAS